MALDFMSNPNTLMLLCALIGFVFANMMTKGFVIALIRVRLFKQGNVVVCIAHKIEDYYVPGQMEQDSLDYKPRKRLSNGEPKRHLTFDVGDDIPKKAKYRSWGCDCVMVDDAKSSIYIRENGSYKSVGGFNSEAMAEQLDTALKKPSEDDVAFMPNRTFQIMVLIGMGILGVGLYLVYKAVGTADDNNKLTYDEIMALKTMMQNATITAKTTVGLP